MNRQQSHRGGNRAGNGNGNRNGNGQKKSPPAFKLGPIVTGSGESVSAAVWETPMKTDDGKPYSLYRISVESSYFSKDDNEWRHGTAFKPSQLGALHYLLTECSRFVFDNSVPPQNGDAHEG